jgi:hypothetical protein
VELQYIIFFFFEQQLQYIINFDNVSFNEIKIDIIVKYDEPVHLNSELYLNFFGRVIYLILIKKYFKL